MDKSTFSGVITKSLIDPEIQNSNSLNDTFNHSGLGNFGITTGNKRTSNMINVDNSNLLQRSSVLDAKVEYNYDDFKIQPSPSGKFLPIYFTIKEERFVDNFETPRLGKIKN